MSAAQSTVQRFAGSALSDADPYDEGMKLVFTPVQLYAIMHGETISAPETWSGRLFTRVFGGAQMLFGADELAGAAGLFASPEPTMLTKAGGVVLGANGLDNAGTGAYELWTGHDRATLTAQAAEAAARALGANPDTAHIVGIVVDIAVPVIVAGGLGAARALSVRRGLIDLAEEEAAGGHTIAKHVAKDDAFLLNRLATEPKITGAGTFASLKEAERGVSEALRAFEMDISNWAKNGAKGQFIETFDAGRPIGRVIPRGSTVARSSTKITFRLKKGL